MLPIDPLEGPRGLISFANFLTPLGASRQVCMYTNYDIIRTPPMMSHHVQKRFLPNSGFQIAGSCAIKENYSKNKNNNSSMGQMADSN